MHWYVLILDNQIIKSSALFQLRIPKTSKQNSCRTLPEEKIVAFEHLASKYRIKVFKFRMVEGFGGSFWITFAIGCTCK